MSVPVCIGSRGAGWTDSPRRLCFAEARGIFATPTLVFGDGTRVSGAIPAGEIEKRLAARR